MAFIKRFVMVFYGCRDIRNVFIFKSRNVVDRDHFDNLLFSSSRHSVVQRVNPKRDISANRVETRGRLVQRG